MNLLHWAGASQDSQPPARLAMPVMARSYALFGQEPNADRTFYVAISPRLPARPPPAPERWGIVAAARSRGGSAIAGRDGNRATGAGRRADRGCRGRAVDERDDRAK